MNDLKWIRENPNVFDAKAQARGLPPESESILKLDVELRDVITRLQQMQSRRNTIAKEIAMLKKNGADSTAQEAESVQIKDAMESLEKREENLRYTINATLSKIPNCIADDVPMGASEADNEEIRRWGKAKEFSFTPRPHYEIGESLGMMDFETAAMLSGSRFTVLKKDLAKLERAIAAFMLDTHTAEFGYTEMYVPQLVKEDILYGTGQLPKFADDLFKTTDDRWLIPTAEVPLTNTVRESIIDASQLPIRLTAYTQCFRGESGSAGKDTRGMIRNHQFSKVELVSIVHPDMEFDELERMTMAAETILRKLELPYRVIKLCSGDIGFSARKTYDIEVWIPSEGVYREISSCSTCGQFQARRMSAKFRDGNLKDFVVTLNGSGLAVGRTLVAILENYQNEDGSVSIPKALRPYMMGKEKICNE